MTDAVNKSYKIIAWNFTAVRNGGVYGEIYLY